MKYKHLEYPLIGLKISVVLLFLIIFSGLAIIAEEAHGQDTLQTEPYHVVNPNTHKDTLFIQGQGVKHLVDSTGIAVFIYDPNEGFWRFSSVLSTGLIDD